MVKTMKMLAVFLAVVVVGCTTVPQVPVSYGPPTCATAKTQIPYLEQQFAVFQTSRRGWPETAQDRQWVNNVKNTIWWLRSTCPAGYL